uniref:Capsular polysaccharide biosynthesis protein n=1 Tax=Strongyloides venezuelensis TaxID=75913 RepID=A0A0K0FND0_STRVS
MKNIFNFIVEKNTNHKYLFLYLGYLFTLFLTKYLITSVVFPSLFYIVLGYVLGTIIGLSILNLFRVVKINNVDYRDIKGILTYSICYGLALLTSVIGLHKLSLPTFAIIKGTSIIFTCLINYQSYNLVQSTRSRFLSLLVILMILLSYMTDTKDSKIGYFAAILHAFLMSLGKHIYKRTINHATFNIPTLIFYSSSIVIIPIILFAHINGDSAVIIFFFRHNFISHSTIYLYVFLSLIGILLNFMNLIPKERQSFDNNNYLKNITGLIAIFGGMIFTADYDFNFINFVSVSLGFVFLSLLNLEVSEYYIDEHVQLLPQINGQKLHDDK